MTKRTTDMTETKFEPVDHIGNLMRERDRASDACASVQKERDELREMLGESVGLIERAQANTAAHYRNWHSAARAFLARYEALK